MRHKSCINTDILKYNHAYRKSAHSYRQLDTKFHIIIYNILTIILASLDTN